MGLGRGAATQFSSVTIRQLNGVLENILYVLSSRHRSSCYQSSCYRSYYRSCYRSSCYLSSVTDLRLGRIGYWSEVDRVVWGWVGARQRNFHP